MKRILLLGTVALALSGCTSTPQRAPNTPKTLYVYWGATAEDDTHGAYAVGPRPHFEIEDLRRKFETLADLKAFVVTLPTGTVLHWDSGCMGYHCMPLSDEKVTVEDFKEFAKRHGVKFEHVVSGY